MIASINGTLGALAVAVGLGSAVLGGLTVAYGVVRSKPAFTRLSGFYAACVLGSALLGFAVMERALAQRDYSLLYITHVGSSRTPLLYNIAALWSSLEGSILLWALILSGYTALVVWKFRARRADPLVAWATITLFAICTFFFLLLAGPANPFRLASVAAGFDGPGPNPLLQNHILVAFHPPMLYLGYVGFSVPFAFAVAALVTGRVGEGWLLETRRWTLFAWGFLTAGIVLGAWWAYEVTGWGGYWGWDAVENASLLPWLTGTAFVHSVMVQERRGMLRVWNLSLLAATFSLTILGTYLTRSGVVESVHAFSNSSIGGWLLTFFGIVVLTALGLIGWRGDRLRSPGTIDSPISREGAFLANNVLFAAFAFVVLLGTVYPLVYEATKGTKLTVGPPFFDAMTMPIGLALLTMMAIAPALPWRKASTELLRDRLFWPAVVGVVAMGLSLAIGGRGVASTVAFGLGGFAAGAAGRQLVLATRRQGWRGLVGRANGGMIVHLGVILVAVALAASQSFQRQGEFSLTPNQTASLGGHTFTYLGIANSSTAQKDVLQARVLVDGHEFGPAIVRFRANGQQVLRPSVQSSVRGDVYLTLEKPAAGDEPASLRVVLLPLVPWLWAGGLVMVMGTALAAFPGRRRRLPTAPASAPVPGIEPVPPGEPAELAGTAS